MIESQCTKTTENKESVMCFKKEEIHFKTFYNLFLMLDLQLYQHQSLPKGPTVLNILLIKLQGF